MKKHALVLLSVGLFVSASALVASAADEKTKTIKEIMGIVNKGPKALATKLKTALEASEPKWDVVQKDTKEVATLTEEMTKLKPKKGDAASWEKHSKALAADAKELHDAADNKDKTKALAAFGKIGASCKSCHTAHK